MLSLLSISEAQVVPLPDSIATLVMQDLLLVDHLKYTVNLKDSIILVYKHTDSLNQNTIRAYKLTVEEYRIVVKNLEEVNKIKSAQLHDKVNEHRRYRFKTIIIDVAQTVVILILTYLLVQ